MSPAALQNEARWQRLPWQFFEQQSPPAAQLSPRFLQVEPGRVAQAPSVHVPEQHAEASEHWPPICVQVL